MGHTRRKLFLILHLVLYVSEALGEIQQSSANALPGKEDSTKDNEGLNVEPWADNKRPSDSQFVRFGKRDTNPNKGHSFMYFGKRASPEERNIAELFHYLQRSQEPSWKRGHSIMRFGKKSAEKHNFIRFGKRGGDAGDDMEDLAALEDAMKRGGHSMMYFGKRDDDTMEKRGGGAGHSMMYFGKREADADDLAEKRTGHSMMYFGKREGEEDDFPDKRGGHSMMYFGKRDGGEDDGIDKRAGHSMMYFGKRDYSQGDGAQRRAGHSMMYFGKRLSPEEEEEIEKRAGHSMMYFSKRLSPEEEEEIEKRAGHSMMYFGKRDSSQGDGTQRRAGHSMMYFGKRDMVEPLLPEENEEKRAKHDMMYFGKRQDESDGQGEKRAHHMIHFGKREDSTEVADLEKKASHSIIRFGKRLDDPHINDIASSRWLHNSAPFESSYSFLTSGRSVPKRRPLVDKKKHNMMHFGKRSVDEELHPDTEVSHQNSEEARTSKESNVASDHAKNEMTSKNRKKREVYDPLGSSSYVSRESDESYAAPEDEYLSFAENPMDGGKGDGFLPSVRKIRSEGDTEKSKNVFLRFG